MVYKAEYIWIDGTEPTARLRSKTRIIEDGRSHDNLPIWGFDGSSTNQAPGDNSDCVLKPVAVFPDPIRGGDDILVLCEVLLTDMTPHPTNTRSKTAALAEKYADMDPWFGIEQEYTFFKDGRPLGWPQEGYYYPAPQGPYYCGVGSVEIAGRDPGTIDVAFACKAGGNPAKGTFDAEAHLEGIARLAELGVTWIQVGVPGDSPDAAVETIERYGELVISAVGS